MERERENSELTTLSDLHKDKDFRQLPELSLLIYMPISYTLNNNNNTDYHCNHNEDDDDLKSEPKHNEGVFTPDQ